MPVLFIDSGGVVQVTYRDNQTSSAGASAYTFPAMSIGPASGGRYVIASVAWSANVTLSSATIGGVAATLLVSAGPTGSVSAFTAILIALVPTGTTADVVINLTGAATEAACVTSSILGISALTAAATATSTAASPTGTLSCQAGGAIIGCAMSTNNPVRTAVWTGVDEDIETAGYGFSGTRKFTAAHTNFGPAQTSLACTCTFSGSSSGGAVGAFAAFNPS